MKNVLALTCLVSVALAGSAWGAPGLPITKPPVQPTDRWTGPAVDPCALQGQWFLDPSTGAEQARPYEFHDDLILWGGGWKSTLAIEGYAMNIGYSGANITSFDVNATITDDRPALSYYYEGGNTHGEGTPERTQDLHPMLQTKLTASFAIGAVVPPAGPQNPPGVYVDITPHIVATNHDELAWYCWTPDNDPSFTPYGGYWVPTWDFGDIDPCNSSSRVLSFTVDGAGLDPNDPRFVAIQDSYTSQKDLLSNRTESLKISNWLDTLALDTGVWYPSDVGWGSDVSVFYVPEPGTLALLALGGLAVLRRRR